VISVGDGVYGYENHTIRMHQTLVLSRIP